MYHSSELAKKHQEAICKAVQNPETYHEFLSYIFGDHIVKADEHIADGVTHISLYYKEKPQIENAVMKVALRSDYRGPFAVMP